MPQPRLVRFQNRTYHVSRISSSGLGEQYAAIYKDDNRQEKSVFLSDETVRKEPQLSALFEACRKAYRAPITLGQERQFDEVEGI